MTAQHIDHKMLWTPPKIWEDKTAFVIGGGPSLIGFDWDLISKHRIVGVNDAYLLGPFIDYNIFGDNVWFKHHRDDMPHATCIHVGAIEKPLDGYPFVNWMVRVQRRHSESPGHIGWYGNTGLSGICLAVLLGATRICLLGFDMKLDEDTGEANWHDNPLNGPNANVYPRFIEAGKALAESLRIARPDVTVLNCNPDSALDAFERVTLESVL